MQVRMPPPKNNVSSSVGGVGSESDRKTMQWIFETCYGSGLPRCAAFRACVYVRRASGRGDVGDRCDRLFLPDGSHKLYPFPVRPFAAQCLWTAVKMETRDWDLTPFKDVATRHVLCLRRASATPNLDLQDIEFEIAEALEWKLAPTSPFLVLSETATPVRTRARASDVIKAATISGVCGTDSDDDADAEVVAMASIVAAEVIDARGSEAETHRCARAVVACVESGRLDCFEQVSELAERMEAATCANKYASPRLGKRRRYESADSPSSVIQDGGAGGAGGAKGSHA